LAGYIPAQRRSPIQVLTEPAVGQLCSCDERRWPLRRATGEVGCSCVLGVGRSAQHVRALLTRRHETADRRPGRTHQERTVVRGGRQREDLRRDAHVCTVTEIEPTTGAGVVSGHGGKTFLEKIRRKKI